MAFLMKRGDLRPYLPAVLEKPKPGVANPNPASAADWEPLVEIADATSINFVMRRKGDPAVVVKRPATIVDVASGAIEYHWQASDTAEAGEFEYEFEILWPGAEPQTVPVDGYYLLTIIEDIG